MAFLDVGNGKSIILKLVESQRISKTVSLDEVDQRIRAESRRKSEWDDWNKFEMGCRARFGNKIFEDESFVLMRNKYRMNVEVNDLDILSLTNEQERRTRYVRRLKCIPHLVSDQEYSQAKEEVEQVYEGLLTSIQNDALSEVKEEIIFNNTQLDFNYRFNVPENNKYYLDDEHIKGMEERTNELQELLEIIKSEQFSIKNDKGDIFALCSESAISSFKSLYNIHYEKEKENEDVVELHSDNLKK